MASLDVLEEACRSCNYLMEKREAMMLYCDEVRLDALCPIMQRLEQPVIEDGTILVM